MWRKVCISNEPSYKNNVTVDREFNLPYAIRDQAQTFVPTSISPTLYGMLYSVVMFLC